MVDSSIVTSVASAVSTAVAATQSSEPISIITFAVISLVNLLLFIFKKK